MQVFPLEAGKGKKMNSTLDVPEETQSYQHLDFSPFSTADIQNYNSLSSFLCRPYLLSTSLSVSTFNAPLYLTNF